ncbi:MAG: relaxase/mobilization nuclease domain-containing protein [Vicinamibacterales bacterium]
MIPRVGRQGKSFKGAAKYYLHDKDADTAKRVAHTETRNLPTDDPDLGWRVMASTAMDSDRLKREAGVDRRGRKLTKPAFHMSLSWHPDQAPDRAHMVQTMDDALSMLGLDKLQAIFVIHNDEPHPHIHALVNLVNPDNGRSNSLRYSKERLSRWAEAYEREHGIKCEQRIENNRRRDRAQRGQEKKFPRYKEKKLDLSAEVARRYKSADNGKALIASLEEIGFKVAKGRRIVLIGPDGKEHSLSRQMDGVTAAQVRAKLRGIDLPTVDDARRTCVEDAARAQTQRPDARDKEKKERQRQRPPSFSREHAREDVSGREQSDARQHRRDGNAGIKHEKDTVRTGLLNRLQDAHHDQWGRFFMESAAQRDRLGVTLDAQYGAHERALRAAIAEREQRLAQGSGARQWYAKHVSRDTSALENDRLTLASIEQRKAEAQGALERSLEERRSVLNARQAEERDEVPRDFSPRELDPLARSIETQQAEANAAYQGAAAPADAQSSGTDAGHGASGSQDVDREAFMDRMNGDRGFSIDHGGH